jgi:hypothetical protein
MLNLEAQERAVGRVLDFDWLHGYAVPTLLLLHEPRPLWVGRYAATKDGTVATALAIEASMVTRRTSQKGGRDANGLGGTGGASQASAHPNLGVAAPEVPLLMPTLIWSLDGIPSDSFGLLPLPQPLGGSLVLASSSILHVNQSTSAGLALCEQAELGTAFNLWRQQGLAVTLDGGSVVALSESEVLCSLRSGDLYLLQLVASGRLLESMRLQQLQASVVGAQLTRVGKNFLFLGSRLANSILLRMRRDGRQQDPAPPPAKKAARMKDAGADATERAAAEAATAEEIEIFGEMGGLSEKAAGPGKLHFSVCDFILNVAPVSDTAVVRGSSSAFKCGGSWRLRLLKGADQMQTPLSQTHPRPDCLSSTPTKLQGFPQSEEETAVTGVRHQHDLVACVGYGKNSSVSTVRTTVKPQVRVGRDHSSHISSYERRPDL